MLFMISIPFEYHSFDPLQTCLYVPHYLLSLLHLPISFIVHIPKVLKEQVLRKADLKESILNYEYLCEILFVGG